MMEEKKSMENNQTPDNKEGKERILKIKEAGEIGVKKFRYRVDFRVLN